MGMYCCCGQRKSQTCLCEQAGWHNLEEDPFDLPTEDGVYLVRYSEDCENNEVEGGFSIEPKKWSPFSDPTQWEFDFYDGWMGWSGVYAWMPLPKMPDEE